jgi:hypothetical protein
LGTQDTAQTKQSEKQPNTEHYKDEQQLFRKVLFFINKLWYQDATIMLP